MSGHSSEQALGYTLGTGRLFVPMPEWHRFAEALLGRPILTHEFTDERLWAEMRATFEDALLAASAQEPAESA
jgi:hypothetical protein